MSKNPQEWEIKITKNGPALFDNEDNCYGNVTLNKDQNTNLNLQAFLYKQCESMNIQIILNAEIFQEINKNVQLSDIYFANRRTY